MSAEIVISSLDVQRLSKEELRLLLKEKEQKCSGKDLSLTYQLPAKNLEDVLVENGWKRGYEFHSVLYLISDAMPFKRIESEVFTFLPLTELPLSQKQQLIDKTPANYNPYAPQGFPLEPLNSLCILHQGELVGWIATHRIDQKTIRYSRWYVLPVARKTKAGALLLFESTRRHFERRQEIPQATWCTQKSRLAAGICRRSPHAKVTLAKFCTARKFIFSAGNCEKNLIKIIT